MLNTLFARNGYSVWKPATYTDLPALSDTVVPTTNHFLVLAGGLALVLSRQTKATIERSYPHTRELYEVLRRELKRYGRTGATSELMLETFHEVAELLDPATRNSLRECIRARQQYDVDRRRSVNSQPPSTDEAFTSRAPLGIEVSEQFSSTNLKQP